MNDNAFYGIMGIVAVLVLIAMFIGGSGDDK